MSYCFDFSGFMTTHGMTREDVIRAGELFDDAFANSSKDGGYNGRMGFDGYCKYHLGSVMDFFTFTAPFTTNGEITCDGEEGQKWKYVFNNGLKRWEEYQGETFYPRPDQRIYWLTEEDRGLILGLLLNTDVVGMDVDERRRLRELIQKFGRDTE